MQKAHQSTLRQVWQCTELQDWEILLVKGFSAFPHYNRLSIDHQQAVAQQFFWHRYIFFFPNVFLCVSCLSQWKCLLYPDMLPSIKLFPLQWNYISHLRMWWERKSHHPPFLMVRHTRAANCEQAHSGVLQMYKKMPSPTNVSFI